MTRNTLSLSACRLFTLFAVLALVLPRAASAQTTGSAQSNSIPEKGVHFEDNLSWSAIQAKARAENKFIFVDCYTSWCGPCKYMAKNIFPQQEAGDFFNDKFIS